MLTINDILTLNGIPPNEVTLVFSKPKTDMMRRAILNSFREPSGLDETVDLTSDSDTLKVHEAYMATQSRKAESVINNRKFCMFFVPVEGRESVLTGLFEILSLKQKNADYFADNPHQGEVSELSIAKAGRKIIDHETHLKRTQGTKGVFDLKYDNRLENFRGRLFVKKPPIQAYALVAGRNNIEIHSIREHGFSVLPIPHWRRFIVSGAEVRSLPSAWRAKLEEWRGVYLITDESDGARYVGSAYGADNILGRWREHVADSKGITKELSKRNPANFRFSILQLLAPDADAGDVINIEHGWMDRLHTREFGLNV